ncbi:MAG: 50S ribosomal protein L4 [Candidatus Aenigmarchaeota archaeon]|nr:50S ribosomal protein L4 [Candidatus Aenigmarchaeota archaeon]
MKIDVLNLKGKSVKKIEIPKSILEFPVREDLILRDFLSIQSKKRQPYGNDPWAGLRTSAHYHGLRHPYRVNVTQMGTGMARHQRIHGKTAPHMIFTARVAPNVRKGHRVHGPKAEKVWEQKINRKEKKLAILSAIAASFLKDFVSKRGHEIDELKVFPIVVTDEIESIKKAKELKEFLKSIGLEKELERIHKRKVRAGKGKMRGRRYKKKKGPLIIVTKNDGVLKAARNLNIDVCLVDNLNTELLAPGAQPGRLTIWSENALKKITGKFKKLAI